MFTQKRTIFQHAAMEIKILAYTQTGFHKLNLDDPQNINEACHWYLNLVGDLLFLLF